MRTALAPEYRIERELASGGMGLVFVAHDLSLDRPVAIKVMRPELATARATDQFLREARILAALHHANVVPVHRAGEADGLFYYVMEFVEGETLEARLARGPLALAEGLKLGRDVLDGLEAAHRAGIIHRDLKPANVLLVGKRALLADFGIARSPGEAPHRAAIGGRPVGTPGYMPPEQAAGAEVTGQTDLYAAGAVLYEAFTGRRWQVSGEPDWPGVPRPVQKVLRRALAVAPADRWPNAATFRRALWRTRTRRYLRRTLALAVTGVAVGGVLGVWLAQRAATAKPAPAELRLHVGRFGVQGSEPFAGFGDSLARLLAARLAGYADLAVLGPGEKAAGALELVGVVDTRGDPLRAEVRAEMPAGVPARLVAKAGASRPTWKALADSLAFGIVLRLWDRTNPLAEALPVRVLPVTQPGLAAFVSAERLFAQARWSEAHAAYQAAEAVDPTCLLCSWRLSEVERWTKSEHDPARTRAYLASVDSFPPAYRSLIRAAVVPLAPRLDTLQGATRRWPDFFLAWFQLGDELLHRGPLIGELRRDAIEPLETATRLRPDFAPAWEHLAWASIADGDSATATLALGRLRATGPARDPLSGALQALLSVAYAWRFLPPDVAARLAGEETVRGSVASFPQMAAGPRLLLMLGAADGTVAMGGDFAAQSGRADLARSGLVALALGDVALGRPDAARGALRQLVERFPGAELELFTAELLAAWWLADSAGAPQGPAATAAALFRLAAPGAAPTSVRQRAAGMLALVGGAPGSPAGSRDVGIPVALRALGLGMSAARAARWEVALEATTGPAADSAARTGDAFVRTLTRLERAEWQERANNVDAARRELRWHEHSDFAGFPTGVPQGAEVDWAFSTLGEWRRAELLDRSSLTGVELCVALREVQRLWRGGTGVYRARADTAQVRAAARGCRAGDA